MQKILGSLFVDLGQMRKLLTAQKTGDLGRPEIIAQVIEREQTVERRNVMLFSEFFLCSWLKVAIPAMRPDQTEHVGEFSVAGAYCPALDRGEVVANVERKGAGEAEIS